MDADPYKRPTAEEVYETIKYWHLSLNDYYLNKSQEQINEMKSTKKIFLEMDEIKFDPSTITATLHPEAVYTSRLLKFTDLPQPVNSNNVIIISNYNGNYQKYHHYF